MVANHKFFIFAFRTENVQNQQIHTTMKKLITILTFALVAFSAKAQSCPDNNHPHMIDLGLPSGTKWACCNVGAATPEENGGYYAWGETEEKEVYDWSTYTHSGDHHSNNLGKHISKTQYDVAHEKWGDKWQMPTYVHMKELYDNCTYTLTSVNGTSGLMLTSKFNGASIFLPAAGFIKNSTTYLSDGGMYWSDTQNENYIVTTFEFIGGDFYLTSESNHYLGCSVRPVIKGIIEFNCPDDKHPHAIDLGLPSGTKWACCNVGSTTPEENGGYYAWGETEEKDVYDWSTYTHCDGSSQTCRYLGTNIAGTEYDVAHVKWGGDWKMPTRDQMKELANNSYLIWATINGNNGMFYISKINGRNIFLPNVGFFDGDSLNNDNNRLGCYWSDTYYYNLKQCSLYLQQFSDEEHVWNYPGNYSSRACGLNVRPVMSVTDNVNLPKTFSDPFNKAVYNIYGIKVANHADNINTLSPGIYIVNGKKIVIK